MCSQPIWSLSAALHTSEGELVSVQISVEPRRLEDLLEALAEVSFPINPQLHHPQPGGVVLLSTVEFPAYTGRLDEVRAALLRHSFDPRAIRVHSMLRSIRQLDSPAASPAPKSLAAGR